MIPIYSIPKTQRENVEVKVEVEGKKDA